MNTKQWIAKGSRVDAPDGSCVCLCSSNRQDGPANAEFICRSVNSHDALLAACQQVLAVIPDLHNHGQYQTDACCATLRAAIAQATGNESGKE